MGTWEEGERREEGVSHEAHPEDHLLGSGLFCDDCLDPGLVGESHPG